MVLNTPKKNTMTNSKLYVKLDHVAWRNGKGQFHRENGPAIVAANGTKEWLLNGELHREDGPAVEYAEGSKEWLLNDKLHREDGPAIENPSGTKYWYLNGIPYTEKVYNDKIKTLR